MAIAGERRTTAAIHDKREAGSWVKNNTKVGQETKTAWVQVAGGSRTQYSMVSGGRWVTETGRWATEAGSSGGRWLKNNNNSRVSGK